MMTEIDSQNSAAGEKKATCTKCGAEPRQGTHRWGARCRAEYRRGNDGGNGQGTAPSAVTLGALERLEAEGTFARREGHHCPRCGYPAGEFLVPLDDKGWRILGQDPRGWAPGHGDPEKACCRMFVCYDMRPGHRNWAGLG